MRVCFTWGGGRYAECWIDWCCWIVGINFGKNFCYLHFGPFAGGCRWEQDSPQWR